jgi:molecular chaperone GrpE
MDDQSQNEARPEAEKDAERRKSLAEEAAEDAEAAEAFANGGEHGPTGEAPEPAPGPTPAPEPPPSRAELERLRAALAEKDRLLEDRAKTIREQAAAYRQATAEFEAARERLRRDIDQQVDLTRGRFLKGFLDLLDNLERALSAPSPEDTRGKALLDGVKIVREQFLQKLKENGVERMQTVGAQFDPELHEALTTLPGPPSQDNQVAHEARAGYTLNGKLLRPAQVVVFKQ